MNRSGTADLPLHGGRVPEWLASRMQRLGTAIVESIVHHYGAAEFLARLSDPFWFQALGAVMGMDWHSSGITTSVLGALKRGLNPRAHELGIYICGGRGKQSRKTPVELLALADRRGFDGDGLVRASRLAARIDNNAIGDGFQLYLHSFVVTSTGDWAIVQQGMNERTKLARRYHWHSPAIRDFVCEPHAAIVGEHEGLILNLVDRRAKPAQEALLAIAREKPEKTLVELRHLAMPRHHDVRAENVDLKRLGAVLMTSYERQVHNFAELLLTENLGPRTLQTLALVAEVIHGAPSRFSDPARFSFALGGKDGHPFPVPLKTYDESISVLRRSLDTAKLGNTEKTDGLKRLDRLVWNVERQFEPVADFEQTLAREHSISKDLNGRSVFDDPPRQLALFS
ncbi:MAG TPA: DUF763 domain-containing protein [Bryobacteraceae bacterium]|jgi:hypothetical protein|nr:DUF763 domain-containing protein [Bryobacteraceae bacterium]